MRFWEDELRDVIGTVWTPEDAWRCGTGLYLVVARDRESDSIDAILVLDLQTGDVRSAHYDPYQKPSDPSYKIIYYPFDRKGLWDLVPASETS